MTADLSKHSSVAGATEASVDASSASNDVPAAQLHVPAELLDGGEVVILAVKPSPWSVLFDFFPWLTCGLALLGVASLFELNGSVTPALLLQTVAGLLALRLGFAVLQWASRVYVLTNRRIIRIRGVFRAEVGACPLVKILNTGVTERAYEAVTRLGTVWFNSGEESADLSWYHIARPHEVHADVRRAIERALDHHLV